jgi:hypothetical protein
MINRRLKQDLLKKLGITPQALSQRAERIKKSMPMTTEEATYVLAHRIGLKLDRYLDADTMNKLRPIVSYQEPNATIPTIKNKREIAKEYHVTISGVFKGSDPLLDGLKLNEAKSMASIYPLLYVLENSIRQFICLIMDKEVGQDWLENEVPKELKKDVADRMKDENVNAWHQRRGAHPIDYLDLKDLPRLISKRVNKIAPKIIPSYEWFAQMIKEVYLSRCVLCHMNPLDNDSIDSVKLRFKQWQKQIKGKINLIK